MIAFRLPYPPSVNHIWKIKGNGRGNYLSAKARNFYNAAGAIVYATPHTRFSSDDRIELKIYLHPPDARRRDIDNSCKACIDLLVKCAVIPDDSQIDVLFVSRETIDRPDGHVRIQAQTLDLECKTG